MSTLSDQNQHETVLDDHITLMSTTDLNSYITHVNDAFVKISGYSREEMHGQPHNLVRHADMPKAAFADMWHTLQQGEPWTGIVKNRPKSGGHYWVRANAIPQVRNGKTIGYMSIRTKASPQEVEAVEPLYQALRENRSNKRLHKGRVISKRWWGKLSAMPLRWRVRSVMLGLYLLLAGSLFALNAPFAAVLASALFAAADDTGV
ncbi:Aerotaxis receptor [Kluyvera cryocrescens]|uniref:Aerotaxis receptor n=1 Tax=Kluyvera cryocrescens TaxID=580 RepID=A0A485AH24_KLUCR|nr:Aerotaxis receptor [Kluyvera cryocrescens]